jgi:cyclopropane-fatty-acyl-phospholipid synthase
MRTAPAAASARPIRTFKPVTIRFDPGAASAIVRNPSLGAAECFIDGRLAIEQGDILDLLMLMTGNNRWEDATAVLEPRPLARHSTTPSSTASAGSTWRGARSATSRIITICRDRLYDLFLDADRQYSCAYFTDPANSLEQAQLDKKAHIAAKLALQPGMRCSTSAAAGAAWRCTSTRRPAPKCSASRFRRSSSRSPARRAAEAGVADKVKFELIDYRQVTGQFDRIVSVGMFEHVGPPQYRTFFAQVPRLLTPEGVMLLHTIGRAGGRASPTASR